MKTVKFKEFKIKIEGSVDKYMNIAEIFYRLGYREYPYGGCIEETRSRFAYWAYCNEDGVYGFSPDGCQDDKDEISLEELVNLNYYDCSLMRMCELVVNDSTVLRKLATQKQMDDIHQYVRKTLSKN